MKNFVIIFLLIAFNFIGNNATAQSGCVEIESILVNSCSVGNSEGLNEMMRFRVGPQQLSLDEMTVGWANTNLPWNGIIQDATTANATAAFNTEIVSCGILIEPLNGVLPANSQVLLITSYQVSTTPGFFEQLGDTLYVIYANENTIAGHFLNYLPSPSPDIQTATISFSGVQGCSDEVTYFRTQLITTAGNIGDEDGATVNFAINGLPTYINIGCIAPYTPFSADWNIPAICNNTQTINLSTLVTGTPGGTWSGQGVTGDILNPNGLTGSVTLTYSVGNGSCTDELTQVVPIYTNNDASWDPPAIFCNNAGAIDLSQSVTGSPGGTWTGPGLTGSVFTPTFIFGNNTFTYTVGVPGCSDSESHVVFVQALNSNWTNPLTICQSNGIFNLAPLAATSSPGTWSGLGVTGTSFNPAGLSGPISISYTASLNGCSQTTTKIINVDPGPDASWTSPGVFCGDLSTVDLNSFNRRHC